MISCKENNTADTLENLKLLSTQQYLWSGSDVSKQDATVITFFSPSCPLSENYTVSLNALIAKYKNHAVHFMVVVPGNFFSTTEIVTFFKNYPVNASIFIDSTFTLTKVLGATATPQTFVINMHGDIVYEGAIDNWAVDLGRKREIITEFYLSDALNAVVEKETNIMPVKHTNPVGCFIEIPLKFK